MSGIMPAFFSHTVTSTSLTTSNGNYHPTNKWKKENIHSDYYFQRRSTNVLFLIRNHVNVSMHFSPNPIWHNVCMTFKLLNTFFFFLESYKWRTFCTTESVAQLDIITDSEGRILDWFGLFSFFLSISNQPEENRLYFALAVLNVNQNWKMIASNHKRFNNSFRIP